MTRRKAKSKKKTTSASASKPKRKPPYNQNSAIRSALRRAFSRSPIVREVLAEGRKESPKHRKDGSLAKKPSVRYQCQVCGEWVSSTKINVDHIDPVIPADSTFTDWNTYIARLWCPKSNLQRICEDCHNEKTRAETKSRHSAKRSRR
jgi:5-methylcytosine-specific restriction endonuclease McrA